MAPRAFFNNKGFTVVELMVALLILMVGMLGLLQTVNLGLVHNMSDELRNDAVLAADEQMALEMSKPFDLVSTTTNLRVVNRGIRSSYKNYSVTKVGSKVSSNTKSVNITINWKYKQQPYSHAITSLISQFNQ